MPRKGQADYKRRDDLVGESYELLTVEEYFVKEIHGKKVGMLRCRCKCGEEAIIYPSAWGSQKSCGCKKGNSGMRVDLRGKKFGRLTPLEWFSRKNKRGNGVGWWLCQCDCGELTEVRHGALASGAITGCGCRMWERFPDGKAAFEDLYRSYKKRAREKSICFSLDKDQFRALVLSRCGYCGLEPNTVHAIGWRDDVFMHNGLDRVDSNKGYTKENVVPCCSQCNYAKNDQSVEEFIKWAFRLVEFQAGGTHE